MTFSSITAERWPTEIRLAKDRRSLRVAFDDGATFDLPAEYLRVTSPSAEVQGHSPAERKTVAGKRDVEIIGVEPVGNYAVKLVFDDLHDTGIYGWNYLHELGAGYAEKWQAYLDELGAKGLSRERRR
ncbi:gamma-butyrobetaine hydroxylase-like domain-containing protein [Microvirga sp. P5_D2]